MSTAEEVNPDPTAGMVDGTGVAAHNGGADAYHHHHPHQQPHPGAAPPHHHETAAAAAGPEEEDGAGAVGGDSGSNKKDEANGGRESRRFFPRVKQLVNPEWEHFLQGVLHSVQAHQAHTVLKASGVEDNAWYQVFHAVYGGIAADNCSVPQGKNRYHKFKDKIVELWRYMAVTAAPDHDVNSRLWKMGRSQWDMYKSLLVVAGKSPVEITLDAKGSPAKLLKKKGRGKAAATISRGMPLVHYEAVTPTKKNFLPSPLHELHNVWKMSLKHNDPIEMGYIRNDYHNSIKSFSDDCMGGPETPTKLLWHLEGLNELREVEQEPDMKRLIGDTYKQVLQRYVAALNKKSNKGGKKTTGLPIIKI